LREAIEGEDLYASKKLILSAAVSAGKKRINEGYEIEPLCREVDFINLMA
jgi:GH18 family chitinase